MHLYEPFLYSFYYFLFYWMGVYTAKYYWICYTYVKIMLFVSVLIRSFIEFVLLSLVCNKKYSIYLNIVLLNQKTFIGGVFFVIGQNNYISFFHFLLVILLPLLLYSSTHQILRTINASHFSRLAWDQDDFYSDFFKIPDSNPMRYYSRLKHYNSGDSNQVSQIIFKNEWNSIYLTKTNFTERLTKYEISENKFPELNYAYIIDTNPLMGAYSPYEIFI